VIGSEVRGTKDRPTSELGSRELGSEPTFWERLVPRATQLGLERPLFYALRYTSTLLGTPVPVQALHAAQVGRPSAVTLVVMDWCYRRALRPVHRSVEGVGVRVARLALYVRSHWLRMPIALLVYHLAYFPQVDRRI